jgi:pilus assembly protein Flp/PilA
MYHSTIGAGHAICHNGTRGVTKQSHFLKENFFNCNWRHSMNKLIKSVKQFMNDEQGMGAVEYALIVALMAGAIIVAWPTLKTALSTAFGQITTDIGNANKR